MEWGGGAGSGRGGLGGMSERWVRSVSLMNKM